MVSNLRPRQEILGVTPNERTLRRMSIYWGVRPLKSLEVDTTEDICENAIELAQVKQYVEPGDVVVASCRDIPKCIRYSIALLSSIAPSLYS